MGDAYVLSLTQAAFQQLENNEKASLAGCFEESFFLSQTINKPNVSGIFEVS